MLRPRRAVPVALLAFALLTTGCGSDSGDEPTAGEDTSADSGEPQDDETGDTDDGDEGTAGEACALLDADAVSEAVGVEVGPGQGAGGPVSTGGTQETCKWSSVDSPIDTATITIYSEASAAESVKESDPDAVRLDDLGDEAFVSSFASVWVIQGEQSFMAQWYSLEGSDEENQPKSEALARLVSDAL